jgi:hypothetical protein
MVLASHLGKTLAPKDSRGCVGSAASSIGGRARVMGVASNRHRGRSTTAPSTMWAGRGQLIGIPAPANMGFRVWVNWKKKNRASANHNTKSARASTARSGGTITSTAIVAKECGHPFHDAQDLDWHHGDPSISHQTEGVSIGNGRHRTDRAPDFIGRGRTPMAVTVAASAPSPTWTEVLSSPS